MTKQKSIILSLIVIFLIIILSVGVTYTVTTRNEHSNIIGTYSLRPNSLDETEYLAVYQNDENYDFTIYKTNDIVVAEGKCNIKKENLILYNENDEIYANIIFGKDSIWYITKNGIATQIEKISNSAISVEQKKR